MILINLLNFWLFNLNSLCRMICWTWQETCFFWPLGMVRTNYKTTIILGQSCKGGSNFVGCVYHAIFILFTIWLICPLISSTIGIVEGNYLVLSGVFSFWGARLYMSGSRVLFSVSFSVNRNKSIPDFIFLAFNHFCKWVLFIWFNPLLFYFL